MISTLLFDFDGTLADTAPSLAAAVNHVRQQHSLAPLPISTYRDRASGGAPALLEVGLSIMPNTPGYEEACRSFLAFYEKHLTENVVLFPGVAELLDNIEARQFRWGVVTNKAMRFAVPIMAHLNIAERASVIVAGDTTPHPKPHPAPLLYAMQRVNTTPAQCIYIGDDRRDIVAAHAARMNAVAVRWGYSPEDDPVETWQADDCISRPEELWPVIEKLNRR